MFVDQAALFTSLRDALAATNRRLSPGGAIRQPLAVSVGDEFQGVLDTAEAALAAIVLVRLSLATGPALEMADGDPQTPQVRFGLGLGEVAFTDASDPRHGQTGSAWWHAREAIDDVAAAEARRATRDDRATGVVGAPRLVAASLVAIDHLVAGLDGHDAAIVFGLLDGHTQATIAADAGLSQSTVSRRLQTGALAAHDLLTELLT